MCACVCVCAAYAPLNRRSQQVLLDIQGRVIAPKHVWDRERHGGKTVLQFTCFTGTKVQKMTHKTGDGAKAVLRNGSTDDRGWVEVEGAEGKGKGEGEGWALWPPADEGDERQAQGSVTAVHNSSGARMSSAWQQGENWPRARRLLTVGNFETASGLERALMGLRVGQTAQVLNPKP